MDFTSHYLSPLGGITMGSDGDAVVGIWFDGQKYFGEGLSNDYKTCDDLPVFIETRRWLDTYFSGREPNFIPKLIMRGSDFRKRVWEVLLNIPYGQTMTYGEIARTLGVRSAQAIGGAVGHNPISLIIPCHRVIGAEGKLTGYAGGIDKKTWLLKMEGILATS
ncbi:MAG: methylated-DNA--[protein]-cysteine S-methyltransferase [Bacteroidales bacterium]|nr:methylated-DNA--[protein]-cysteine S-methyltransferase [Bacteroidales bacterium]